MDAAGEPDGGEGELVGTRQGRLARAARQQMEANRDVVYARDWHQCVAQGLLGMPCSGGMTLQHRANRGMGGSAAVGDGPQWYVTMCLMHNVLLEQNSTAQAVAQARGWAVRKLQTDLPQVVRTTPVQYADGTWWWLLEDGSRERSWRPAVAL